MYNDKMCVGILKDELMQKEQNHLSAWVAKIFYILGTG